MSKLGWRSPEGRKLARLAGSLGYRHERTGTGHLRFVHRTGAIVIAPSKGGGRLLENAKATLRRLAR